MYVPDSVSNTRRSFIKSTSMLAAAPFVGTLGALHTRMAQAAGFSALVGSPYGPIQPVNDLTTGLPLLKLPSGFSYKSYGWTGDIMSDGQPTPSSHDGMGVVRTRRVGRSTEIVMVRNHERGTSSSPIVSVPTYDGVANVPTSGSPSRPGGGTSNLVFRDGNWVSSYASLAGTLTNCAGGVTPWGTWLTCEETISNRMTGLGGPTGLKHGYVFEVPVDAAQTTAVPIVGMGRFQHEAVAVDPQTGFVYETHDSTRVAGLFRYEPTVTTGALGSLGQGGTLKMAKIRNQINGTAPLLAPQLGDTFELEWVTIDNPDAEPVSVPAPYFPFVTGTTTVAGPFKEGFDKGGAQMSRGEGIWYWNRSMFIVDTAGGVSAGGTVGGGDGCVWELDLDTQVLTCIFVVPAGMPSVGNNADNITVSPKGGIVLFEDGGTHTANGVVFGCRMMGVLPDGNTYAFGENNLTAAVRADAVAQGKAAGTGDGRGNEFCGGTFSPDGRVLFVNIQSPGITFAISGPWAQGPL
ncbi:MAG: DUF839 domain-containing protein [Proteobacteria bacterium]|nr:DUF839 domain-containing protein [Burkholderiales bacterium]